jgi:DNA-binding MarR family transcriptional regulator
MTTDSPSGDDERESLIDALFAAQHAMETTVMPRMAEELMTIPLTMQQLKVLALLVTETEDNTVQGLATTLGVSLATMSGILDRLTTHGMAARTEDPSDHRVRRIVATPEGKATVRRLLAAQPQIDREPLTCLSLDDLRALCRGVQALLRAITAGRSAPPAADAT